MERYIFGEDIESIEPEEKYQESIAERVRTRKQGQKRFSDDYDSNGWFSGSGNVVSKAKGAGLKILTDKQMLNRLPILLAQIQAGNNSIKLKNEIRQILYSLYRSKVLTKTVYNYLIDKLDLKNPNKNMALANLSIYYTWKNAKSTYNNNKFKISAPVWNETFDLPDGSYNISEMQDYIEYMIKKDETIGENAPILIYANTVNNRIVFKIKSGYKLELLSKETMKLLGSTSTNIDADKNCENIPRLENVEVVLVHYNLVNNSYQQHSRVLFTFVPTKRYGQLINIPTHSFVLLKTMNFQKKKYGLRIKTKMH